MKIVPKAALVVALMMGKVTPTTNPGNTITTLNWGASSAYAEVVIIPACIETPDHYCGGTTGSNDGGGSGSGSGGGYIITIAKSFSLGTCKCLYSTP